MPWPTDRTVLYWWRRRAGAPPWWNDVPPDRLDLDSDDAPGAAAFAAAVREVSAATPPADPDNLSGMAIDFDYYLLKCASIRAVTVTVSSEPGRQLTARCLAEPSATPHRVAAEIEQAWLRNLCYRNWEAHLLRVTETSVKLNVATQISTDGYYITGLIVAWWPADAGAEDNLGT